MKKGDKFIVRSARYHFFPDQEEVTYTGKSASIENAFVFVDKRGTKQTLLLEDVTPVKGGLDLLMEALDQPVRTEHIPRNTDNFTVTITEEALKDDIPFIIDAYYTNSLSLREVASLLGVDEKTIRRRMSKHGVPTRTVSQAIRAKYSL